MGFRFRNRVKICPGVYLNLGKKGINSVSTRFGWFTSNFNKDGVKNTLGFHGTGLSYETKRKKYFQDEDEHIPFEKDEPLILSKTEWGVVTVLAILFAICLVN